MVAMNLIIKVLVARRFPRDPFGNLKMLKVGSPQVGSRSMDPQILFMPILVAKRWP